MRQKAVVLETKEKIAKIKVLRSSMCAVCAKRGTNASCACGELLGANRVMIAEASNEIGAVPGDDVEIETESAVVLSYAALVFLFPIAAFFLGYVCAQALRLAAQFCWGIGGLCFLLAFLPVLILDRRRRGKKPQIRITKILNCDDKEYSEDTMG